MQGAELVKVIEFYRDINRSYDGVKKIVMESIHDICQGCKKQKSRWNNGFYNLCYYPAKHTCLNREE